MLDRMKDLLSFFLAAMAMISLLCAVYEAMNSANLDIRRTNHNLCSSVLTVLFPSVRNIQGRRDRGSTSANIRSSLREIIDG